MKPFLIILLAPLLFSLLSSCRRGADVVYSEYYKGYYIKDKLTGYSVEPLGSDFYRCRLLTKSAMLPSKIVADSVLTEYMKWQGR